MIKKGLLCVFAVLVLMHLAGCATGAQAPGMTVLEQEAGIQTNPVLVNQVQVGEVTGGKNTNPLWKSNVSTEEFKLGLESSLKSFRYLADGQRYRLNAQLIEVKQPIFGLNFEVVSTVKYELLDQSNGSAVYTETITASHTAGFSDSALAVKRLRLANEGSIKANIEMLLDHLGRGLEKIDQE